jgi:hypothetical protein
VDNQEEFPVLYLGLVRHDTVLRNSDTDYRTTVIPL